MNNLKRMKLEYQPIFIKNGYKLPSGDTRYCTITEQEFTRLKKEFGNLLNDFGTDSVTAHFKQGLSGFIDSRILGNYSFDSIYHSLS